MYLALCQNHVTQKMVSYWYFPLLLCALICNLIRADDACPEYPTPVPGISVRDIQSTVDAVSANITAYMKQYQTPGGVAVGLVYDQELIWFQGFGLIDDAGLRCSRTCRGKQESFASSFDFALNVSACPSQQGSSRIVQFCDSAHQSDYRYAMTSHSTSYQPMRLQTEH